MTALTHLPAAAYADLVATLLAAGFGDLINTKAHMRHRSPVSAFFVSAVRRYGGLAWETFGSAGFLFLGSPTRVQLPP